MLTDIESLAGLVVVILSVVGIIFFSSKKIRTKYPPVFRKIPGITRLRRAIGLSVETGSQMHVGLGNADLNNPASTSSLVGLSSLHRLGQLSSTSDQPPISTSGDGGISILSKDILHTVSIETNTRELYDPDHGMLTGITPLSYAVGALDIMQNPAVKTNILIGNFGPEVGFLTERSESAGNFTIAASDSLVAQSVFLATTRDVLIGEETFAVPAYLAYSPVHLASLRVQDILRLGLGIALVIGAALKVLGIL